jgi:hypothetical protein
MYSCHIVNVLNNFFFWTCTSQTLMNHKRGIWRRKEDRQTFSFFFFFFAINTVQSLLCCWVSYFVLFKWIICISSNAVSGCIYKSSVMRWNQSKTILRIEMLRRSWRKMTEINMHDRWDILFPPAHASARPFGYVIYYAYTTNWFYVLFMVSQLFKCSWKPRSCAIRYDRFIWFLCCHYRIMTNEIFIHSSIYGKSSQQRGLIAIVICYILT